MELSLDSVVDVEPTNISSSTYAFNVGLSKVGIHHIIDDLIILGPGEVLSEGRYDDTTFAVVETLLFFAIVKRYGSVMDCRYLGGEGSSSLVDISGISPGEIFSLTIPSTVLVCGTSIIVNFPDILGEEALRKFTPKQPSTLPLPSVFMPFTGGPMPPSQVHPHPSPSQVSKYSDIKHMADSWDPKSFGELFTPSERHSASSFEYSLAIMATRRAHDSFSTGLDPALIHLTDAEIWAFACLSFGKGDKAVSIKQFRAPGTEEPTTCGGMLDCLRTVAAVVERSQGTYLFSLLSLLQGSLSSLITSNPSRFNGDHVLSICEKVFSGLKMCSGDTAADRRTKHPALFSITEDTAYVAKHLRDVLWRAPSAAATPAKGKRILNDPSPDPDPKKGSPEKSVRDIAYSARGPCATSQNTCARKHAYPASTTGPDKRAYADWAKSHPK